MQYSGVHDAAMRSQSVVSSELWDYESPEVLFREATPPTIPSPSSLSALIKSFESFFSVIDVFGRV